MAISERSPRGLDRCAGSDGEQGNGGRLPSQGPEVPRNVLALCCRGSCVELPRGESQVLCQVSTASDMASAAAATANAPAQWQNPRRARPAMMDVFTRHAGGRSTGS